MVAPFAAAWTQSSAEERMGPADDALNGGLAVYQVYETQDGGHLAVGALEPKFMVRFAEAAGHPEWLEVPPIPGPHNEGLKASIAAVVASKTVAEWTEILADVDCCVGPVLTPRQAVGHPQFVSRNRVGRAAGGDGAWVECPLGPEPQGEAPSQGQHTQEILREIGLDDAELRELRNAGTIR